MSDELERLRAEVESLRGQAAEDASALDDAATALSVLLAKIARPMCAHCKQTPKDGERLTHWKTCADPDHPVKAQAARADAAEARVRELEAWADDASAEMRVEVDRMNDGSRCPECAIALDAAHDEEAGGESGDANEDCCRDARALRDRLNALLARRNAP